jgi:transposase
VERAEAEAIYDAGREAVVEVLLAMDRRILQLEAWVEKLERQLAKSSGNSSRPPSTDSPRRAPGRGKDRSERNPGGQPAMRVVGARCCRRGRLMSSSITGR